jgi:hypothetical protein
LALWNLLLSLTYQAYRSLRNRGRLTSRMHELEDGALAHLEPPCDRATAVPLRVQSDDVLIARKAAGPALLALLCRVTMH